MNEPADKIEADRQLLRDAESRGTGAKFAAYTKLSGPGWLQSAITLGGGSLAGSLYLGVIGGYQFMWLQPIMMILGILMLSVIAYVTLSTGERPFGAINKHINPVLGWGWLIAAMMANMVWAMPQFSLGTAALEQNLMPGLFGSKAGPYIAVFLLFLIGAVVVWFYEKGSKGVKMFEVLLKIMVGIVVLSFFGVVIAMSFQGDLPWGSIIAGFIPNPGLIFHPADSLQPFIDASGDKEYWTAQVLKTQQDRMIAAAATAVGINMTFLLPYSMLKKGWGREFRGLATFDLSTGLFIPFLLATSCVVIAAASQFHGKYDEALVAQPAAEAGGAYRKNLEARVKHQVGAEQFGAMKAPGQNAAIDALPAADKQLAAMLVQKDAFALADSLKNLTGGGTHYVFGIGVLGMAISTIIILMLINGFCLTELCGAPPGGTLHLIGSILPGITGALGFLFLWGNAEARFWLAIPTSRFGMVLLPVAYVTFFFMINSKSLMKDQIPTGGKKLGLNIAMLAAIGVATFGCAIAVWNTNMNIPGTEIMARWPMMVIFGLFVLAVLAAFAARRGRGV